MLTCCTLFIFIGIASSAPKLAETPPRGWNSYDSYVWAVNETEVLQNAEAVVKYLKPFGYNYITIDYGWFLNITNSQPGNEQIYIDEYGRPQPDTARYPHSINQTGFKWLSQQIHSMGLLFGIHTSRGISMEAYNSNTPIYGATNYTSKDIGLTNKQCPWGGQPFMSVNMSHVAGQTFYNSLYSQYAEWGVDFIKNDCVFAPYVPDQINAVHTAIENSGRTMIYSVSAGDGDPPSQHAESIYNITNLYRTSGDDWDKYSDILTRFNISAQYANAGLIGAQSVGTNGYSWPDADMLPFGYIASPSNKASGPYRWTDLSKGQQRIQMTLWSIIRSPLIFGGVVMELKNDSFTLDLLTNKYCLDVNLKSNNNRQIHAIYNINNGAYPSEAIWSAHYNDTYYVAFFNLYGNTPNMKMNATFQQIGISNNIKQCSFQSAFDKNDNGITNNQMVIANVAINDTTFYVLNNCK